MPFTIREFDNGVNYNMKFENTSSDATPKNENNANAEITNTESTSIDGQNKVQGQPETNIETVSNSTEAKNAEVVVEVKKRTTTIYPRSYWQ